MKRWQPPEIEDVSEPFCGCRRRHMVPLVDANPMVASEWCYQRNAGWGPEDFSYGSKVRAWWDCPRCQRRYKASICSRTGKNHTACPYCASQKVCEDNALSVLRPAVSREWHPQKNGKLKPSDVMRSSSKMVWWFCGTCKHEWQATINARTSVGTCCPACYQARLEYARQHPRVRNRPPAILSKDNKAISRAWYEAGRIEFISLSKSHPSIAKQWHPTANGKWTPDDFARGSEARAWWKCEEGPDHEWQSPIYSRTVEGGHHCPFCIGKRVSVTNSLKMLFPEVAKQWHPTRNGKLKPNEVTAYSHKKVWWICSHGSDHVWETSVSVRTAGKGCPYCGHRRTSKNENLKVLFPDIAAQLHPTKNPGIKAQDIAPFSKKLLWWICKKGPDHEWQATPGNRAGRGSGCPFCTGKRASVTNSLASLFPRIAREWHKRRNGKLRPSEVTTKSSRQVWWQCRNGHSWQQTIGNRTTWQRTCPQCKETKIAKAKR